ncbi:MAG: sulfotransferase [Gemmataceae bacterium]
MATSTAPRTSAPPPTSNGVPHPPAISAPGATTPEPPSGRKPEWTPRIWHGVSFLAWMRILARGRFAVHFRYLYIAVSLTIVSFFHTLLAFVQEAIFGRRIRRTKIEQPPIFILGHWRTGTTLLHELMILDPRFAYPNTYECLDPSHFLLTESLFKRLFRWMMPKRRPMDNMKAGFDKPQEEEFALCMLGQPSPYLTIAFPARKPICQEWLDFDGVPSGALRSWKRTFKQFLKQLTCKKKKRLVLKSPPHTARIKVLKEMFPDAIFIHIVRDPYVVYPSTVNLWKTFYRAHGLQKPNFDGLDEHVLDTYVRMYRRLEEGRKLLPPGQFYELKYEDLVKAPEKELLKIYDHFHLGGWNDLVPHLREYLAANKGYETNKYALTAAERAKVTERWGEVIRRYGYDKVGVESAPAPR